MLQLMPNFSMLKRPTAGRSSWRRSLPFRYWLYRWWYSPGWRWSPLEATCMSSLTSRLLSASISRPFAELLPPASARSSSSPHTHLCLYSLKESHSSTLSSSFWMAALLPEVRTTLYFDAFCKHYKSGLYCLLQVTDRVLQQPAALCLVPTPTQSVTCWTLISLLAVYPSKL